MAYIYIYKGATFGQNFDFKIRKDNQKSYKRRVHESVDDNSLYIYKYILGFSIHFYKDAWVDFINEQ